MDPKKFMVVEGLITLLVVIFVAIVVSLKLSTPAPAPVVTVPKVLPQIAATPAPRANTATEQTVKIMEPNVTKETVTVGAPEGTPAR